MTLRTYVSRANVFIYIFFMVLITACSKVDVEEEVRNLINAECKLDKVGEDENLSPVQVKAALDEFNKTIEETKARIKTQDEKDEFLIFYSAVRKQEQKCVKPIFNRENLEVAKAQLNAK